MSPWNQTATITRVRFWREAGGFVTELDGVSIARCPVPRAGKIDSRHQVLLIREALRALSPSKSRVKKTA